MKIAKILLIIMIAFFGSSTAVHAIILSTTFSDLNETTIGSTPIELDQVFDTSVDFQITNDTGMTWTDFHMALTIISFNQLGPYLYTGPGTETWSNDYSTIDILGLDVSDGDVLKFSITCDGTCTYAGVTFTGYPTVNGGNGVANQVSEPSTLLILGLGLLVVGIYFERISATA